MPGRSLWKTVLVLVLVNAAIVIAAGAWLWWRYFGPLPPDQALRTRFSEHRADFDSLAIIACADSELVVVVRTPNGFSVFVRHTPTSNRRLSEMEVAASGRTAYRRLLGRAGLPRISRTADARMVWFRLKKSGAGEKGIIYSEKPLAPLVPTLDGLEHTVAGQGASAYVSLAPRWFLFLEPGE